MDPGKMKYLSGRRQMTAGLLLVLGIGGIWWSIRAPRLENNKLGQFPTRTIPAPFGVSMVTPPATPTVPARSQGDPPPAKGGVQTLDLQATVTDMAELFQEHNLVALLEKYQSPVDAAKLSPEAKLLLKQDAQQDAMDPDSQDDFQFWLKALQSLKDLTPELSFDGKFATYRVPSQNSMDDGPMISFAHPTFANESPTGTSFHSLDEALSDINKNGDTYVFYLYLTLQKIDGKWYFDSAPGSHPPPMTLELPSGSNPSLTQTLQRSPPPP